MNDALRIALALGAPTLAGGLIGWLTNYLAVKMLFRPRLPVRFGPFTLQGVFPKRQQALALNLGMMIERELFSHEDIRQVIADPEFQAIFKAPIAGYVDAFIAEKLFPLGHVVQLFLSDSMRVKLRNLLTKELEKLIPDVIERASEELERRLDVGEMIRQRVEALEAERLEELLFTLMSKEFGFIELSGGVLGALIGLLQGLLNLWLFV